VRGIRIRIAGNAALRGAIDLPADRMVAHRALLFGALADGDSTITDPLSGPELDATKQALRSMGVSIESTAVSTRIAGVGTGGLQMPAGAIDCVGSRTTFSLMSGVLAGQRFGTRLLLSKGGDLRPIDHMVGALRARGAHVAASGSSTQPLRAPLSFAPLLPGEELRGIECQLPEPDLDAKSAILVSGLFAAGSTAVSEPLLSPDHTERMLSALGVPMRRLGSMAGFDPAQWNRRIAPFDGLALPGDTTVAAFISAAASAIDGSRVALRNVGWNPTRTGFFDAMRLLGARLLAVAKGDGAGHEPVAEVQTRTTTIRAGAMGGEVVSRCCDSLPALFLLAARCPRGLEILDAESYAAADDPLWAELSALIAAFGAECVALPAGLSVAHAARLRGAHVDARNDPRLAWTAVLFGLASQGETLVENADCLAEDASDALACMQRLGAVIEVAS
jgi:3-phosphoshikimate 1-carboxyvinyltransferase